MKALDDFAEDEALLEELRSEQARSSKLELKVRTLKLDLKEALQLKEEYQLRASTYEAATSQKPPAWMTSKRKKKKDAVTVMALLSDCHFDEIVKFSENGLNSYNREIAEMRLKLFVEKVIQLSYDQISNVSIEGLVLCLGGDLVSGNLHDLGEHNETPYGPVTCAYWSAQLVAAIEALAKAFPKVHIVNVVGNHGRLTFKPRTAGRARDSWDWLIAHSAQQMVQAKNVTWQIPESHDCLFNVYNTRILLTHGDAVRGGGGIGGIWPPIKRLQARLMVNKPHDLLVMGHWHQLTMAASAGLIVNGSLKGFDSYAAINGFSSEPAQQAWWVVSPTRGITMQAPLFVEDKENEGWG